MRIVHAETGKFHHIRRISFYSVEHDEFNPAPVTGNILLRDSDGPLQPGTYLLPDMGSMRIVIRRATDTNEFAVPNTKLNGLAEPRAKTGFLGLHPRAGSNP